jgi:hypothetical protein
MLLCHLAHGLGKQRLRLKLGCDTFVAAADIYKGVSKIFRIGAIYTAVVVVRRTGKW